MGSIERLRPSGLLHNPAFSQVVVASGTRTIYTAGQVSIDERGELVGSGDLGAQTAQAMRNVGLALKAAGASYADIVKITTFVVDYRPEHRAVIGKARTPFFSSGGMPASTLLGVSALAMPEWLIEIEAVAVLGGPPPQKGRDEGALRTNDAVLLSVVGTLLDAETIGYLIADQHMSVLEGSLGFLPRRILVRDDDLPRARRLMINAELAHELRTE